MYITSSTGAPGSSRIIRLRRTHRAGGDIAGGDLNDVSSLQVTRARFLSINYRSLLHGLSLELVAQFSSRGGPTRMSSPAHVAQPRPFI